MDSQGSKRGFQIVAAAGRHDRRGVPARAELPLSLAELESLGPPELFVEGRKRAVHCQLVAGSAGGELWWFLDSLRAGETLTYTLLFGGRQRRSPRRARLKATSTGLAFQAAGRPLVEFLLPRHGVPRLSLRDECGPLAILEHRARPAWLEEGKPVRGTVDPRRTLHRVRQEKPRIQQGPIVGDVHVAYDYLDASDHSVLSEEYHVRIFVPHRAAAVMDYRVTWRASSGALTIYDPDSRAYQRVPSLHVRLAKPPIEEPRSACGAIGREECNRVDPSDVWLPCGKKVLGIILDRAGMTWPVAFGNLEASNLEIEPSLCSAHWAQAPVRLALGEALAFAYRFVLVDTDSCQPPRDFPTFAFPMKVEVREMSPTNGRR